MRVTQTHALRQGGWRKPHGMEQTGEGWSSEAPAKQDRAPPAGLLQPAAVLAAGLWSQNLALGAPLLILSVPAACCPPDGVERQRRYRPAAVRLVTNQTAV